MGKSSSAVCLEPLFNIGGELGLGRWAQPFNPCCADMEALIDVGFLTPIR